MIFESTARQKLETLLIEVACSIIVGFRSGISTGLNIVDTVLSIVLIVFCVLNAVESDELTSYDTS